MTKTYKIRKITGVAIILLVLILIQSCKKSWLDAKPVKSLVVPNSIADYQAILDYNTGAASNGSFNCGQPSLAEVGSGDLNLSYATWQSLSNIQERNAYIWLPDILAGTTSGDWNYTYKRILNANIVLEGIEKINVTPQNQRDWNNVKGTALFFRAYDFFSLVQTYAKAYDATTAETDLGIPLRSSPDLNVKYQRATVQASYEKIVNDLMAAKTMVPTSPLYPTRAGKGAVYSLLSRIFLSSGSYEKALVYADSALQINDQLLNFNNLSTTATTPILRYNQEVIYHHSLISYGSLRQTVDPTLYSLYNANDLRKIILYKTVSGLVTRKASYNGDTVPFGGLATDEMYLILAECYARKNMIPEAMNKLNKLLLTRWKTGTFTPYTSNTIDEALAKIFLERRKELVFRGIRWNDLKRLNNDPRFAITLNQNLNGTTYTLLPNDQKYVMPIPQDEILLNGLQQNPR